MEIIPPPHDLARPHVYDARCSNNIVADVIRRTVLHIAIFGDMVTHNPNPRKTTQLEERLYKPCP